MAVQLARWGQSTPSGLSCRGETLGGRGGSGGRGQRSEGGVLSSWCLFSWCLVLVALPGDTSLAVRLRCLAPPHSCLERWIWTLTGQYFQPGWEKRRVGRSLCQNRTLKYTVDKEENVSNMGFSKIHFPNPDPFQRWHWIGKKKQKKPCPLWNLVKPLQRLPLWRLHRLFAIHM